MIQRKTSGESEAHIGQFPVNNEEKVRPTLPRYTIG